VRSNEKRTGVSAVEFAIVLPLLILVLFGIIEFSLILYDKAMLTNASREGARAGIVTAPRVTPGEIDGIVKKYCQNHLVTSARPPDHDVIRASTSATTDRERGLYIRFLLLPKFAFLRIT